MATLRGVARLLGIALLFGYGIFRLQGQLALQNDPSVGYRLATTAE